MSPHSSRLALILPALCLSIAQAAPPSALALLNQTCAQCHNPKTAMGGLDLSTLPSNLDNRQTRDRWIRIHDRIQKQEMPPKGIPLAPPQRTALLNQLAATIYTADHADIAAHGRGPMRRLNRSEYEQNLRDILQIPHLDIRDMLPEDREGHHFNKTSETLDMSRVQLAAYLDAAESALRQAMVTAAQPPPTQKFRAIGINLFPQNMTSGEREAMFFAKNNLGIDPKQLEPVRNDPELEVAIFRSAHWPYYGYPRGFVAKLSGAYRVRFSARAVRQFKGYQIQPATHPIPLTFRSRQPSGPDVSGDVRATGGIIDIQPETRVYETTIRLHERETFEYSILGLPVPYPRNVNGGPPSYRFPPLPDGGQPGVAIQWVEVEGPIPPSSWPPPCHRVLFDNLGPQAPSTQPREDAKRLLRRFVNLAAHQPVSASDIQRFEHLILKRLDQGTPFPEAMLAGYKAFLSSVHFLYLPEPQRPSDHFAIASRLAHFLTNTRPDATLFELARAQGLRDPATLRRETARLIASPAFDRFIDNFTAYWLNLRHIRRDDPDSRLYPEYRFDEYLVESMEQETRTFFTALIRENLPARSVITADFLYANDRLAQHYQLPPLTGSTLRKVSLPPASPLGGLLTQAAILKVTANGTTTSPVIRGAWIMDRLIGEPPPPPPAAVPAVEPDIRGAKTIRDLLALHTKSPSCAACHARFDPVGLALENFDILGGWRTRYRGLEQGEPVTGIDRAGHDFAYTLAEPVDASGQLLDGQSFKNIRDLKAIFAANPRQLARNLLHQFTVYSTGTPVSFSDRREIESMLDACSAKDYRVGDLLQALVQSRIFLGPAGVQPTP